MRGNQPPKPLFEQSFELFVQIIDLGLSIYSLVTKTPCLSVYASVDSYFATYRSEWAYTDATSLQASIRPVAYFGGMPLFLALAGPGQGTVNATSINTFKSKLERLKSVRIGYYYYYYY